MKMQRGVFGVLGAVLVALLITPVAALIFTASPTEWTGGLGHPLVWPALSLSLWTTITSLVVIVVFGTPLAWVMARSEGRWVSALETALQLPIVIPPAVAGVALLLAFGRRGLLPIDGLSGSTIAVILAQVFVSAPFFVQSASSAFRRIDDKLITVARTFGASPTRVFFRIAMPLALPGLVAGMALSWARALGEFGATLMFAGNLEGRTQTLPLAIYTAFESDLAAAQSLSIVLVIVAFGLLVFVRMTQRAGSR